VKLHPRRRADERRPHSTIAPAGAEPEHSHTMNWEQFFSMGGYGFYVWTSYALMAAVLLFNLILPWRRKSEVVKGIARRLKQEGKRP
jgi:heme exporter protein D